MDRLLGLDLVVTEPRAPEITADARCILPQGPCNGASYARSLPAQVSLVVPFKRRVGERLADIDLI